MFNYIQGGHVTLLRPLRNTTQEEIEKTQLEGAKMISGIMEQTLQIGGPKVSESAKLGIENFPKFIID